MNSNHQQGQMDPKDVIINALVSRVHELENEIQTLQSSHCSHLKQAKRPRIEEKQQTQLQQLAVHGIALHATASCGQREERLPSPPLANHPYVLWVWNGYYPDDRPSHKALFRVFEKYGPVHHVFNPPRVTFSKVWMGTLEGYAAAIRNLDGATWRGHILRVDKYKGAFSNVE